LNVIAFDEDQTDGSPKGLTAARNWTNAMPVRSENSAGWQRNDEHSIAWLTALAATALALLAVLA
jgi:hypothetical protein